MARTRRIRRGRHAHFGSAEDTHARSLVVARNAVRSATKGIAAALTTGNCARADTELRRATYFEGQAAVHYDASMPYLAQGAFRDSLEARELDEAAKHFRVACVRDRIKKG